MFGGRQRVVKRKAFKKPYVCILSAKDGGSVRYLLLPARIYYHCLDPVKNFYDMWHCRDCNIMGDLDTFKRYNCS